MGNLYNLNHMNPAAHDYGLGTELNKIQADLADRITGSRNFVCNAAGLAVSGTDLKYQAANAFYYFINGVLYYTAAQTAIAVSPSTGLTCGASKYAAYLVEIDASAAVTLQKAADATSQAAALAALADVTPDPDKAPVGVIHIQNDSTAFTPGATAAGHGDFADDTTADTYLNFVGVSAADLSGSYTQTFAAIT
jgi:hypothetical protein